MARIFILLSLLFIGCTDYQWGNRVEVALSDKYPESLLPAWKDKVAQAATIWKEALGPNCPEVFPMDSGNEPSLVVVLYPREDGTPGQTGEAAVDGIIQIKGPNPDEELGFLVDIIVHEMGHFMNLHHDLHSNSVMNPLNSNFMQNWHDIEVAQENLGCL